MAAMMLLPIGAAAQDAIHGVDGYYNFTPTQMKASGMWHIGNNGKKLSGYYPEIVYDESEMTYAKFIMGVNNATPNDAGVYGCRSEFVLEEVSKGDGCMQITSAYPVIAFKFSAPVNNVSWDGGDSWGYYEPEFSWYNPEAEDASGVNPGQTSGNKNKLQLNGLDNNGRYRFVHYSPTLKDIFGRDSVQLNRSSALGEEVRKLYSWNGEDKLIWRVIRLLPNESNPELADLIIAMDLSTIVNADGTPYVDLAPIKMKYVSFMALSINGTLDERPYINFKWLKTFTSMDAFNESLCDEQNWGDGPKVDPNKAVLNGELYAMKQLIKNYQFSDQIDVLNTALTAATTVYNDAASTSADYAAQVEALATAKQQFMTAIVYDNSESKMSTFYSLTGMALGLSSQDVTVGNYTGKYMTLVSAENAANFLLTKNGEVAGQTCYIVQTGAYSMVQASDQQLLFVPATQLSNSSARANLVLSNRKTADDPGYDFKVGQYYYYYSEDDGEFTVTTEFPTVEDESELTSYLFYPQAAAPYDVTDHNEETHPMISGEGSWNEFNGEVDVVINPAYEYSFAAYDWDAAAKATAMERAKQNQFEGWRTNGWRLRENIEAATLENGEKVMKVTLKPEYDLIHNDSVSASMATTDFTNNQFSIMREHGAYSSALNKAPINNQQCDSLWAINMNAGINRYFAMKWKANSETITFNGLTFFVRKNIEEPGVGNSTLLEKRGDVYVWDLLDCGIPYGDRKACAQYMSWNGVTSPQDAVYVDWMRFYSSLDEIPSETMEVPAGTEAKEGDVNGDGAVDVADISAIISRMAGDENIDEKAADVNGDGAVDVADISSVITIMAESSRRSTNIVTD